jgi:hypothetical protein
VAGIYLALTALLIVAAAAEYLLAGTPDGSFLWGFALMATAPLSVGVMMGYSEILTARGVPPADHDADLWTLVGFAACALVNSSLLWVLLRGRRIPADQHEPD